MNVNLKFQKSKSLNGNKHQSFKHQDQNYIASVFKVLVLAHFASSSPHCGRGSNSPSTPTKHKMLAWCHAKVRVFTNNKRLIGHDVRLFTNLQVQ